MFRHKLMLGLVLTFAANAAAQFNQSIAVEGKYIPEVLRLDRINTFPKQVKFTIESSPLSYEEEGVTTPFAPVPLTMEATGWRDTRPFSRSRGYVEAGAGSWLNSTLSAGYRILQEPNLLVGASVQHNATMLWRPDLSPLTSDIRQRRLDEAVNLYGAYRLKEGSLLSAELNYHYGNFNYYGFVPLATEPPYLPKEDDPGNPARPTVSAPGQHLNDISFRAQWNSSEWNADPLRNPSFRRALSWNTALSLRSFGYGSYYTPQYLLANQTPWLNGNTGMSLYRFDATRETALNLNGEAAYSFSPNSSVRLGLEVTSMIYGNPDLPQIFGIDNVDSYFAGTINPAYRFVASGINLQAGARIDLISNAGPAANRYGFFHIAPDLRADYQFDVVHLSAAATGGSRLVTLASNYDLDYYQSPLLSNTTPVWVPLDFKVSASANLFSGFTAGVSLAYRIANGERMGGWYQTYMNCANYRTSLFPIPDINTPLLCSYSLADSYNLRGYSLGTNLSYNQGKWFKAEANINYQPQNGTTGYFNGYDRARTVIAVGAETNPWSSLRLRVGYDYREGRSIYTWTYPDAHSDERTLESLHLTNLGNLSAQAQYEVLKGLNVWVRGNNLLNRHDQVLPYLPTQGIQFTLGGSYVF